VIRNEPGGTAGIDEGLELGAIRFGAARPHGAGSTSTVKHAPASTGNGTAASCENCFEITPSIRRGGTDGELRLSRTSPPGLPGLYHVPAPNSIT
jgi:hypothetical protein